MKLICPIEGLPLVDYLALEAELVKTVSEPALFTWVVRPTVIYGHHQIREQEVNEAYCAEHGIAVVQRKSGGGCVYADEGNLMVSFVTPSTHSEAVFGQFMEMISGAFRQMGYDAVTTEHNDVLVGAYKVCGTACYTTTTGTVVHACILYDVNLNDLEQSITPTAAKLAKHAVASVRQRVRNLREINDLGPMPLFRRQLEQLLSGHVHSTQGFIFDLDGTLLNTIADLGEACNHALAACGYATHAREDYPRLVGNGVRKLMERALRASLVKSGQAEPEVTETMVDELAQYFVPYYDAHNCVHTHPYEGIPELLAELKARGYLLAVASNKYQRATETIVAHFFPGMFDVVLGERNGVPRKPDPQIVKDIITRSSVRQFIYVGDSLVDRDTARNAGLPFVACSWGFVPREQLVDAGCTSIADKPDEIQGCI